MNLRKTFSRPLVQRLPPSAYGAEVLCAGWNPAVAAAPEVRVSRQPASISAAEAETFLVLFYRLQQI